jgi:hypothetical protein
MRQGEVRDEGGNEEVGSEGDWDGNNREGEMLERPI